MVHAGLLSPLQHFSSAAYASERRQLTSQRQQNPLRGSMPHMGNMCSSSPGATTVSIPSPMCGLPSLHLWHRQLNVTEGLLPEGGNGSEWHRIAAPAFEERQAGYSCTHAHSFSKDSRACSTRTARPLQAHLCAAWYQTTQPTTAQIRLTYEMLLYSPHTGCHATRGRQCEGNDRFGTLPQVQQSLWGLQRSLRLQSQESILLCTQSMRPASHWSCLTGTTRTLSRYLSS